MIKKKDNLTDLVENLPRAETAPQTEGGRNQQVVNTDGEIVTLGQQNGKNTAMSNKRNSLELSLEEIRTMLLSSFKKAFELMGREKNKKPSNE